ncbi:hypothetical protein CAL12_14895 [Bordetella genomosp. 8]|uniref:Uncharacterized protein n=1 Tax=Bordetella genomosp. 8 TaxID=1416806 RepID=A0A1W6YLN0_9BORD|nr:hypothetical protein [Bordetella genomosp. 8]ARP81975.1 hypothetical protein CAL12_14895 [Bordetella genomosp. 8]
MREALRDGIDVRRVVRIGLAGLAVLVLAVTAAMLLASRWDENRHPGSAGSPRGWIAGPMLETRPQASMAQYLEGKRTLTDSYAWIDRGAGIARIPVEEAMRAVAEGARP